jgi:hypothetical protein
VFPSSSPLWLLGWYHLAFFGLYIPLAALRGRRKLLAASCAAPPNRLRHMQTTAFMLVLLTGLSLYIAPRQGIELFPRAVPPLPALVAGVAFYAAAVAYMRPRWRRAVEKRARVVHLFMPANATERAWWIAVSVLAGVGEEITWRGVQAALLITLMGSFWIAALISAASFGGAHALQGWKSVGIIVLMALGFHALVWLSGSLYVAMAVHLAYDITAGLNYGRLGRELGYSLEPAPVPQAAPR